MSSDDYIILIRLLCEFVPYYTSWFRKNNNSSVLLADIQVIKTYKTRGKDGEMKEQRVSPREELWPTHWKTMQLG